MKLTKEHLDCPVEGVELSTSFDISFNTEAKEANRTHRVNVKLTSDGITLRELLQQAGKPRVITKQGALRRNCQDEEAFARKCEQADGCTISLKPGAGAVRVVSTDEAMGIIERSIIAGTLKRETCPESLLPYFDAIKSGLAEKE